MKVKIMQGNGDKVGKHKHTILFSEENTCD